MSEAEEKNGEKRGEKRDEKGQFKKGHSGGPGRGFKNPSKPLTYEDIELLLQSDLKDSDPKVRHTATRLLIALKHKMPDPDDQPVLSPEVYKLLTSRAYAIVLHYELKTERTSSKVDIFDAIRDHLKNCPDSPVRPIEPIDDFVVVEDDDL